MGPKAPHRGDRRDPDVPHEAQTGESDQSRADREPSALGEVQEAGQDPSRQRSV